MQYTPTNSLISLSVQLGLRGKQALLLGAVQRLGIKAVRQCLGHIEHVFLKKIRINCPPSLLSAIFICCPPFLVLGVTLGVWGFLLSSRAK